MHILSIICTKYLLDLQATAKIIFNMFLLFQRHYSQLKEELLKMKPPADLMEEEEQRKLANIKSTVPNNHPQPGPSKVVASSSSCHQGLNPPDLIPANPGNHGSQNQPQTVLANGVQNGIEDMNMNMNTAVCTSTGDSSSPDDQQTSSSDTAGSSKDSDDNISDSNNYNNVVSC